MHNDKYITKFEAELMLQKMIKAYGRNQWLKCENCYIKIDNIIAVETETLTKQQISYEVRVWTKNNLRGIVYKNFDNMKAAQKAANELISMAKITMLTQAA